MKVARRIGAALGPGPNVVDLPAHGAVSSIGRFVDHVAMVVPPIEIWVLSFDMTRSGPDVLRSSVCRVRHICSFMFVVV